MELRADPIDKEIRRSGGQISQAEQPMDLDAGSDDQHRDRII